MTLTPVQVHKINVLDTYINYAVTGSGPSLVYVHGWSSNWASWQPQIRHLAHHYQLFFIDLPGFGDSGKLPRYTLDLEAKYVHAFISKLHLKPKALIGASMGTIVSSRTLELYPRLTPNLILIGPMFKNLGIRPLASSYMKLLSLINRSDPSRELYARFVRHRYTAYILEKYLHTYKFDKAKVDRYLIPGRSKVTGRPYLDLGISGFNYYIEDFLANSSHHVLLLVGEAEKYVTPTDARRVLSLLNNPRIQLITVPKSGHNLAYERPGLACRHMHHFLSTTTSP